MSESPTNPYNYVLDLERFVDAQEGSYQQTDDPLTEDQHALSQDRRAILYQIHRRLHIGKETGSFRR